MEPEALAALVGMVTRKEVTAAPARPVLEKLAAEGGDPEAIVEAEGLGAMGDGDELEGLVQAAIDANPDAAEKIRAGKQQASARSSATSCARPRAAPTAARSAGSCARSSACSRALAGVAVQDAARLEELEHVEELDEA